MGAFGSTGFLGYVALRVDNDLVDCEHGPLNAVECCVLRWLHG